MKIIAKKNFNLNGTFYDKGDEVKVDTKSQLIKLNELGFIEPLSAKDIQDFDKPVVKTTYKSEFKKIKEEE